MVRKFAGAVFLSCAVIGIPYYALADDGASAKDGAWYVKGKAGYGMTSENAFAEGTHKAYTPVSGYDINDYGVYGVGLGYDFKDSGLRTDISFDYRRIQTDTSNQPANPATYPGATFSVDGQTNSVALMGNVYYDFTQLSTRFVPYVKAGLGVALNDTSGNLYVAPAFTTIPGPTAGLATAYPDHFDASFAYAIGAGTAINLTDRLSLDIEYQYVDLGKASSAPDHNGDAFAFTDLKLHEVTAGVRYHF